MAAGYNHTVAIKEDGTLWAWGRNGSGQLGDGNSGSGTSSATPVQVKGGESLTAYLEDVIAVSASSNHTVALKKNGTLWAWGYNYYGQLGNGTTTYKNTPVQVLGGASGTTYLEDVIAVSAGGAHIVALKKNGTLWAWGFNNDGQLGDGSTADKNTPVQVLGGASGTTYLEDVIAVSAGNVHTVALKKNGELWAWGYNYHGQLGDGTNGDGTHKNTPVQVKGGDSGTAYLEDVDAVFAGYYHTIAHKKNGTLWAWGNNQYGQLGDGTTVSGATKNTPVQEKSKATDWESVSGGYYHTIAHKKNGTLWAWGQNEYWQLGLGDEIDKIDGMVTVVIGATSYECITIPARLGKAADLVRVSGGAYFSTALRRSGILWTWGDNQYGQLGDGTTENRSKPVPVKWK